MIGLNESKTYDVMESVSNEKHIQLCSENTFDCVLISLIVI
jgi:hypothetical protein